MTGNIVPSMEPLYGLAEVLLRRPLRHGLRWTVEGIEHIPETGPALLASNHVSYLDPLVVAYVADLRGRRVRNLAKAELFDKRIMAWALHQLGQIPVQRGSATATALDAAAGALGRGELVVVFPEGTISKDLEPMAAKTGAVRLARAAGVPVVPVGLWGAHRILTAGRKPRWRVGVAEVAVVGEPLRFAPTDNPREASDRLMAAICAQVARARELYPQHPGTDEDDWWVRGPETARLRSCRGRVAQEMLDAGRAESTQPDD
jgi:1-acyl-sn-glycerol-3-phosphate acyltransferase